MSELEASFKSAMEQEFGSVHADQYKHVCFVGQGPNQTSWNRSVETGKKFYKLGTSPNLSRDQYAEDFAIKMGRRLALTGTVGDKLGALLGHEQA